jgi:hypothetical protein
MKKIACILLTISLINISYLANAQKIESVKVIISNNSAFDFKEKLIEIPWSEVTEAFSRVDTNSLNILDAKTGKQLVYQLEKKGTSKIQNLLIQVSIPSKQNLVLLLKKGEKQAFIPQTYARYVPERFDDFAWENDKIAFRMYGKALEATTFNAYGIDIWAKRTNKLVINRWYKSEDYHKDYGEGMDFYGVGFSLGAGGIAPYYRNEIIYSKNYVDCRILDNGPLRSSFVLFYDDWKVGNSNVKVSKTIQLDAGSQLSKFDVVFSSTTLDSISIVAGIHKTKGADVKMFDEKKGIIGYWEPTTLENGTIGVGCVFQGGSKSFKFEKDHLLNLETIKINKSYCYYAGGAWDKAGEMTSSIKWFNYLDIFSEQLKNPITYRFKIN